MTGRHVARQIAEQTSAGDLYEPLERVFSAILREAKPIEGTETLKFGEAGGRVLARDVAARANLPRFDNAAVDGYGIGSSATVPGDHCLLVTRRVCAGDLPGAPLGAGEAVQLLTGAAIPGGVAAVVAEERCRLVGDFVSFGWRTGAGHNIRRAGEDVASGSVLLEAGSPIGHLQLAILAANGSPSLLVKRCARVGVLSCGNELVEAGSPLNPGTIPDTNRPMLAELLRRPFVEVSDLGICRDDPAGLSSAISSAAKAQDLLVTSGGVFGSERDCIGDAIVAAGGFVRRFKIAMKPGKCLLLGRLGRMTILALPGNPLAALVTMILFGRPLLAAIAGIASSPGRSAGFAALAASDFPHMIGRAEFALCRCVGRAADGRVILERLESTSAHLRPLILADGFAEIPADKDKVTKGSPLQFHPFADATSFGTW